MKKWCYLVAFTAVVGGLFWYTGHSHLVSGTEQVFQGTLSDRGMDYVELKDVYLPWEQPRPYVGVAFGEVGDCFFLAKGCALPEGLALGEAIRVEVAVEEGTNLTVATCVERVA